MKKLLLLIALSMLLLCAACDNTVNEQGQGSILPAFQYEELALPENLTNADHLFCCYSDAKYTLLSVCSDNGRQFGPLSKTDSIFLCDIAGGMQYFTVATDAYITSAVPHKDGVLYVDYEEYADGSVKWSVVYTDGETHTTLDSGSAVSYDRIPYLFKVGSNTYYIWEDSAGFGVDLINNTDTECVIRRTDCALTAVTAYSNAEQYYFIVSYSHLPYATFVVCNTEGVVYEYTLGGKITSCTIADTYAVCGVGNEETGECWLELIDLFTGQKSVIRSPYGALYTLRGNGEDCVCVDSFWNPYYVSLSNKSISPMPSADAGASTGTTNLFYPIGSGKFFVMLQKQDGYRFYHLTLSDNS